MPLPSENTNRMAWPPIGRDQRDLYMLHDAWYSGDPERLGLAHSVVQSGSRHRRYFWAGDKNARKRVRIHMPVAGDISAISADLLFSEPPRIKAPDGVTKRDAARLADIVEQGRIVQQLSAAAETCSAIGGVFLKVNIDPAVAPDHPILSVAQADQAAPEFRSGRLVAVTFWKILAPKQSNSNKVWRLLERHEPGVVEWGLYEGTVDYLGERRELDQHPETLDLDDEWRTGIDELLAVYVPNMLPNRRARGSMLGGSDYLGVETLMDSLDRTWTSLFRDIDMGLGRLIAPLEYFKKDDTGEWTFDLEKEAYIGMVTPDASAGSPKDAIIVNQWAIRSQEHIDTIIATMRAIFTGAGYSAQSFGIDTEGRTESGTALNIRERRSIITTGKKAAHWRQAIQQIMWLMLKVDSIEFNRGTKPFRPDVTIEDSVRVDGRELATSVELIERAKVATIETKIRMLHSDWDEERVQAEAAEVRKLYYPEIGEVALPGPGDDEDEEEAEA